MSRSQLKEAKKQKLREEKLEKKKKARKNREFAVVTYSFLTLFICMVGYLGYFLVFDSEKVINNDYNSRQNTFEEKIIRGDILDSTGDILATTQVDDDGNETRYYPYGEVFAHVIGYSTQGKTGVEAIANFNLLRSNAIVTERLANEFEDQKNMGDTVVTTLDATLQQAAYEALGDTDGAVVVIEPSTGKILAMVSKPSYNPNTVSTDWDSIIESTDSVLLNRATQGLYPPGSIFKIFTTLEYIRENPDTYESYSYNCGGSITYNNYTLNCYDSDVHGALDLRTSFAKSCNSSFANIGLELNINKFKKLCKNMLFNSELPFDMEYKKSSFTLNKDSVSSEIMMTAIGQGETEVTPIHMAMIGSAIANNGVLMKPYLIDKIQNYTGTLVTQNSAAEYGELMTQDEAAILKDYMTAVVSSGTGYKFNGVNYTVAGKTGSAEYSSDKTTSHSWFVGFTPAEEDAQLAISVIAEGGGSGSETAVPIARSVLDAYYGQ